MGESFFNYEHIYQVNCDISSNFVAILLFVGTPKEETKLLSRDVFKEEFLGNLDLVVDSVDCNLTIPFPEDYDVEQTQNMVAKIKRCPLLEIRDQEVFDQRKQSVLRNIYFLLK